MTEVATPPSGDEQRLAAYHAECREKYDEKAREALAKKGIGYALPDGSFPTDDASDVEKAVHAVGRGGAGHDHIRVHIMAAAKRLGCMDLIPGDWRPDGSIKAPEQKSQADAAIERAKSEYDAAAERATKFVQDAQVNLQSVTDAQARITQKPRRSRKPRHSALPPLAEVRFYNSTLAEFREDESTGLVTITGTPIVYNTPYTVTDFLGEFTERMNDSVGADVVARGFDVRLLENHKGLPYARTKPGNGKPPTLFLEHEPGVGLRMRAVVDPDAPRVQDLLSALARGDVSEMSVGFMVAQDEWNTDMTEREILRFKELLDVSIVTFPASPTTSVEMARARKTTLDLRAGAVMSSGNLSKTEDAIKALHALYSAAGKNPADLIQSDDTSVDDTGTDDGSETSATAATDGEGGNVDGSGVFRGEVDPGEKIRALTELLNAAVERNQPTPEDWSIASALKNLKGELAIVKAKQLFDPDNATDPDDADVMAAINEADAAIEKAIVAQSKDSHEDARADSPPIDFERLDRKMAMTAEVRALATTLAREAKDK